jgi:chromosome segregation ATPase
VSARPSGDPPVEGRFARTGEQGSKAAEEGVSAAELVRRIEEQADLLARARSRFQRLKQALEHERAARATLADELKKERARSRRLAARLEERSGGTGNLGGDSAGALAEALERADALERELGQSWERIEQLRLQLGWASRPLWRKLLRKRPAPR